MKKVFMLTLATVCLLAALTACGQKNTEKEADDGAAQEESISGVVNRLGDYLVLLDGDGEYRIFDFGKDVDASALEEGDQVKVTYTGTLGSEDPAPVAVAIEKTE